MDASTVLLLVAMTSSVLMIDSCEGRRAGPVSHMLKPRNNALLSGLFFGRKRATSKYFYSGNGLFFGKRAFHLPSSTLTSLSFSRRTLEPPLQSSLNEMFAAVPNEQERMQIHNGVTTDSEDLNDMIFNINLPITIESISNIVKNSDLQATLVTNTALFNSTHTLKRR